MRPLETRVRAEEDSFRSVRSRYADALGNFTEIASQLRGPCSSQTKPSAF